jgi:hypothetical protein
MLWSHFAHNRSLAGEAPVILSAAKDLVRSGLPHEILRCAQDDAALRTTIGP